MTKFGSLKDMPTSFEPSSLQGTLERQRLHLPSSGLLKDNQAPKGLGETMAVVQEANPEQLVDFSDSEAVSRLKPPKGIYRFKIGSITNVPRPKETGKGSPFNPDAVIRAEVRCIMIDPTKQNKLFHSNCHVIPARIIKGGASWVFPDTLNLVRDITLHCENASKGAAVLFELVMTVAADDANSLKKGEFQLTVGWGSLPLSDVAATVGQVKVDLYGGSPRATQQMDASKLAEKQSEGMLAAFNFFGSPEAKVSSFHLAVDCQTLNPNEMTPFEKVSYLYLP